MGFFKRLLSGAPPGPGDQRPPTPSGGLFSRSDSMGSALTPDILSAGPFPRRMRVRACYSDYALYGSWQVVDLESPAHWDAARERVRHEYYKQFGLIHLPDGNAAIRWNESTWRGILETLDYLYDPQFSGAGEPATSSNP